jgi:hypothetical protein
VYSSEWPRALSRLVVHIRSQGLTPHRLLLGSPTSPVPVPIMARSVCNTGTMSRLLTIITGRLLTVITETLLRGRLLVANTMGRLLTESHLLIIITGRLPVANSGQ